MKKYKISWTELISGALPRSESFDTDIKANNPQEAILLWAKDYINMIEEIKPIPNDLKELHKIDIQAFYSKKDGKFNFTDLDTSGVRYSE